MTLEAGEGRIEGEQRGVAADPPVVEAEAIEDLAPAGEHSDEVRGGPRNMAFFPSIS